MAPPSDVYRKVGTQPAWSLGPVGSRIPSPGAKRWGGSTSTTRHRPRSGSLKTRPIRPVPSRVWEGRLAEGPGVVGGGERSDAAKWNRGRGKWARVRVRAGGDNIDTLTAVVG